MKRRELLGALITGFLVGAVLLTSGSALASSILQAIYVDFRPINIYIDGQERNPPADMQSFVYEGRTYVFFRYVGEAFGKKVDWDQTTRSVIIADARPLLTQYSESFASPSSVGAYWIKTGGEHWLYDGPNGLYINASAGQLTLHDILPSSFTNYTIEFEAAIPINVQQTRARNVLAIFSLGKDAGGSLGDVFVLSNNIYSRVEYMEVLNVNRNTHGRGFGGTSVTTSWIPEFEEAKYVPVKIEVKDRFANIHVDGEFVAQKELAMSNPAFAFARYTNLNSIGSPFDDYYVRNFNVTFD